VIRLGSQKGRNLSLISDGEINKAVNIISNFSNIAKKYNAKIRAVATSAVREAKNQKAFIESVNNKTGIQVEVIEGSKEARLIFEGIKHAIDVKNKKVLCVDIGGGSTEFIYAINEEIIFVESVKIGAVRLSKLFFPDFVIDDENVKQCCDYVIRQILEHKNIKTNIEFDFAIGSSGTVDTIYNLMNITTNKSIRKKMNGFTFNKKDFDLQYEKVMKYKTSIERLNVPGLEARRADIIPAGLIILKTIFELFNIKKMMISDYALREGIVFDTLERTK
jgi:exopolyphosphatase/guanosine-5'-triphosphate,3'-diphosphate pyrophosphatase